MVGVLFLFGLCVGSFLNVLIDRVPKREDILWSRSHCDHCKHRLRWYELIPLLSYLAQKGKSRCCRKPLSIQYPLVELATGIGFVLLYYISLRYVPGIIGGQLSLLFIIYYALCIIIFSSLLVIFVSDFKTEIIPTEMIIVSIVSALVFRFLYFTDVMNLMNLPRVDASQGGLYLLMNYGLSAFFAWLLFFCLWFFSKGKAMGDGDMYIALAMGLLLGFPRIIVSLYTAFLTGAIVGVILVLRRKKSLHSHIPFGPFLIWGLVVGAVWGDALVALWRTFI